MAATPKFFPDPISWRAWLERNHGDASELLVGFHKKDSGLKSITWPESVDQALCFGWIDGIRKSIDASSYSIRFTPRRSGSTWSAVNIRRVTQLVAEGAMHPAGLQAFENRKESASVIYSYEQGEVELESAHLRLFQANDHAWQFFQSAPFSYQRAAAWWVVSAKREQTREKRLAVLIADSESGRRLAHLTRTSKYSKPRTPPN